MPSAHVSTICRRWRSCEQIAITSRRGIAKIEQFEPGSARRDAEVCRVTRCFARSMPWVRRTQCRVAPRYSKMPHLPSMVRHGACRSHADDNLSKCSARIREERGYHDRSDEAGRVTTLQITHHEDDGQVDGIERKRKLTRKAHKRRPARFSNTEAASYDCRAQDQYEQHGEQP